MHFLWTTRIWVVIGFTKVENILGLWTYQLIKLLLMFESGRVKRNIDVYQNRTSVKLIKHLCVRILRQAIKIEMRSDDMEEVDRERKLRKKTRKRRNGQVRSKTNEECRNWIIQLHWIHWYLATNLDKMQWLKEKDHVRENAVENREIETVTKVNNNKVVEIHLHLRNRSTTRICQMFHIWILLEETRIREILDLTTLLRVSV